MIAVSVFKKNANQTRTLIYIMYVLGVVHLWFICVFQL